MAIGKEKAEAKAKAEMGKRRYIILLSFLLSLVLGSCGGESIGSANPLRSVRPVVKIGLIAPFEGLYRRTGYESLAAMRAALADHADQMNETGIDILPLALDDSGDPQRAARTAQKLTADPAVGAVIGPINPWTAPAATAILTPSDLTWERPYLAGQPEEIWIYELVLAVNQASRQQGANRLLIMGWHDGWSVQQDELQSRIKSLADSLPESLPLEFIASAASAVELVELADAMLFLGTPADAAALISALRKKHETVPLWMGPQGGDPIFFERADRVDNVYWATWLDDGYAEWAKTHQPATPSAYLVYKATNRAIHAIINPAYEQESPALKMHFFSVEANGISIAIEP